MADNNRIRFTKATLDALPAPMKGARRYFDDKTPGLILRVTANGAKNFYLYKKVNGRPAEIRVGSYQDLSVENARKKADELRGQIAVGEDPAEKRREARNAKTFGELCEWYVTQPKKSGERGARTVIEYRKLVKSYLGPIAGRVPAQISAREVEALHEKVGAEHGRYAANRLLALVRAVFNRAIKKGLMKGTNPAAGVEAFAEQSRERRLMPHEVARFLTAVIEDTSETMRDYVLLSLYTGARKANVLAMRWDELDAEAHTWRIPVTKNGTSQLIPLENAEIDILTRRLAASSSPWVFPSTGARGHLADPKAGWRRILERADIDDLRIHDLRRSLASFMVDGGASMAVIGKVLNHKSQATTAVYARVSMDPQREAKRAAHGAIALASEKITAMPTAEPAAVVALAAGRTSTSGTRRTTARR